MPLADIQVRTIKPAEKIKKISDSHGLYLLVNTSGSKPCRFNYRFQGKQKTLVLGQCPEVSLADARKRLADARKALAKGSVRERSGRPTRRRAWNARNAPTWSDSHAKRAMQLFERDILPWLGGPPIAEVSPRDLLKTLERTQARGAGETVHRARQICGQDIPLRNCHLAL